MWYYTARLASFWLGTLCLIAAGVLALHEAKDRQFGSQTGISLDPRGLVTSSHQEHSGDTTLVVFSGREADGFVTDVVLAPGQCATIHHISGVVVVNPAAHYSLPVWGLPHEQTMRKYDVKMMSHSVWSNAIAAIVGTDTVPFKEGGRTIHPCNHASEDKPVRIWINESFGDSWDNEGNALFVLTTRLQDKSFEKSPEQVSSQVPSVHVDYPVNVEGFDTGVDVAEGQTVSISASGVYTFDPQLVDSVTVTPAGARWNSSGLLYNASTVHNPQEFPYPNAPIASLIASVNGQAPFYHIGNRADFVAQGSGKLFLIINDRRGYFDDNTGTIHARISVR
jgi:hypothetical protein